MLKIQTIPVTAYEQNARILSCSETSEAVIVDPGGDVQKLIDQLSNSKLSCSQIWLTHSHLDHCGGVQSIKDKLPVKLVAHKADAFLRQAVLQSAKGMGLPINDMQDCPEPDDYIEHGDSLRVGKEEFDVLFTPGHCPGHVCFYNKKEGVLLTGDTLFAASIGRTDLPGGDYEVLMNSIKNVILVLPDNTVVMPGHGPDTTISREKSDNPFLSGVA